MQTSSAHTAQQQDLFDTAPWKPKPSMGVNARRVLEVIQGYSKGVWGYCGAFQRTLARVLERSIRWLASGIAELKRLGILVVQQRGPNASAYRVDSKRAELFAELSPPSSITESLKSKTPPRKAPKRAEPDWDAMDRATIDNYNRCKIPARLWPVHLREFAEVA